MPDKETVYFDTSALAKWYLNETQSEEVEGYIQEHGPAEISDLTIVEMRSLLARRRREKDFDAKTEMRVFAAFVEDIRQGFLIRHPISETVADGAVNLISALPDAALRTLDALHLVIAKEIDATVVATSDRTMAECAKSMGFKVVRFIRS